jgi:ABC-2 type transport system permease protein
MRGDAAMMKRIFIVATYEMKNILRDFRMCAVVFIAPFLFALLFGAVYSAKVITEVPIAVLNEDNTPLSREIVKAFDASDKFEIACYAEDYSALKELVDRDAVKMGLVIPHDLEKKVLSGEPVQVLTVFDSSNLIYAYNIRKSALAVTLALSGQMGVKMLFAGGMLTDEAIAVVNAIDFVSESWYNPTNSYVNYLYPGLLVFIIHQLYLLSIGTAFVREKESETELLFSLIPTGSYEVIIGKSLPYFLAGLLSFCIFFLFANRLLHLPVQGNFPLLFLFIVVLLIALTAVGVYLAHLCGNSLQVSRIVSLASMPMFLASGFTWPLESMPVAIRWIMYCQPLTWMLQGTRAIIAKGAGFDIVCQYFLILLIITAVLWLGTAAIVFALPRRRGILRRWQKKGSPVHETIGSRG